MVNLVCLGFSLGAYDSDQNQLLRSETGVAETHTLVTKLIRMVVEAGTLTGMSLFITLLVHVLIAIKQRRLRFSFSPFTMQFRVTLTTQL